MMANFCVGQGRWLPGAQFLHVVLSVPHSQLDAESATGPLSGRMKRFVSLLFSLRKVGAAPLPLHTFLFCIVELLR